MAIMAHKTHTDITLLTYPFPRHSGELLLRDVRATLLQGFLEGEQVPCSCCGQAVKLYPRKITSIMVRALDYFAREGPVPPAHIPAAIKPSGDYAKLRYWGLAEEDKDGWSATDLGRDFLANRARVPERAYVYRNTCYATSTETISVRDVKGFELADLMDPDHVKQAT